LPIALRMQKRLSGYCHVMRKIKDLLNWQETISFWVTSISIAIGIIFLFLPWVFILHWLLRLTVWIFLGPWMRLLDIYLLQLPTHSFKDKIHYARLKGEQNTKLKAVREFFYGPYSVDIPTWNVARHHDIPLPESTAQDISDNKQEQINSTVIPGQLLTGSIIHRNFGQQFDDDLKYLSKLKFHLSSLKSIFTLSSPNTERQQQIKINPQTTFQQLQNTFSYDPHFTQSSTINHETKTNILKHETEHHFTERKEESSRKSILSSPQLDQRDNVEEVEEQGLEVVEMSISSCSLTSETTALSKLYHSPDSEFVDIAFCRH